MTSAESSKASARSSSSSALSATHTPALFCENPVLHSHAATVPSELSGQLEEDEPEPPRSAVEAEPMISVVSAISESSGVVRVPLKIN